MLGVKLILSSPIPRSRRRGTVTANRADACQHLTLRQGSVAHQPRPAVGELLSRKGGQQRRQFRLDRQFDELARARSDHFGQRIGALLDGSGSWVMVSSRMWHIPFSAENWRRLNTAMICRPPGITNFRAFLMPAGTRTFDLWTDTSDQVQVEHFPRQLQSKFYPKI